MPHAARSLSEKLHMARLSDNTLPETIAGEGIPNIDNNRFPTELQRACGVSNEDDQCLLSVDHVCKHDTLSFLPPHSSERNRNTPPAVYDHPHGLDETPGLGDFPSMPTPGKESLPPLHVPPPLERWNQVYPGDVEVYSEEERLREDLVNRWILNLSMRFRDTSNREKFFVTFAERPNKWRRLTISLTYANAPQGSLEAELSEIPYQREKNRRIYQALRECLSDIEFCRTVTNLKLETSPDDGQLHIHVREDLNEVIEYPQASSFRHISCRRYSELELHFLAHLSGFVYKVQIDEETFVKKEIAGPDAIDEFLYEVNALSVLTGCEEVIQLEGLVIDSTGDLVKGLLISYASRGALVDILYDYAGTSQLPWTRREKWAQQIVRGLCEIHEAGYVQGDFTLSNIVIDRHDNAAIIDLNRRGCPMGWEPPELARLISSGQRISMYIGTKTDLFQLGMVLWALAECVDEPERMDRPLPMLSALVPRYFHNIVQKCLAARPQDRGSAKELLNLFPSRNLPSARSIPPSAENDMSVDPDLENTASSRTKGRVSNCRKTGCQRGRSLTPRKRSAHLSADVLREDSTPSTTAEDPMTPDSYGKPCKTTGTARFDHVDSGFDEPALEEEELLP